MLWENSDVVFCSTKKNTNLKSYHIIKVYQNCYYVVSAQVSDLCVNVKTLIHQVILMVYESSQMSIIKFPLHLIRNYTLSVHCTFPSPVMVVMEPDHFYRIREQEEERLRS